MPKISAMMDVGKRSLMNSQTALQTVSHNIASKDVDGYSRQRVEFQTNVPVGEGKLRIGMGAKAAAVTRVNNPYLDKQIQNETGKLGWTKGRAENMARVESIFNEQMGKGLNQFVSEFFNAFRELSNNPESQATRTLVRETALAVTRDFQRVNRQLKDVQYDIDNQITAHVSELNAYAQEIAHLNQAVMSVELNGIPANDERDRREQLLKLMAEKVNLKYAEGDKGKMTVTVGNAVLVSGFEAATLRAVASTERGEKRSGNMDIVFEMPNNGPTSILTEQLKNGELGGAIEIRDHLINKILKDVDSLSYSVAQHVNDIHSQGFDAYGQKGIALFDGPDQVRDFSEKFTINQPILDDAQRIVSGAVPGAPGDNRIANRIASLQMEKLMNEGSSSYDDFFNGVVGQLAVVTKQSNTLYEHQGNIVTQLKNIRESVSGVSLDEEATKMIEFQKTFDASARLIKTADEMMDTVLSLKR